jgi:hypothetical protein
MSQLELSETLPLIGQRDLQRREVVPLLKHLVMPKLVQALYLPVQVSKELQQLREQLVVIELERLAQPQRLESVAELEPLPPHYLFVVRTPLVPLLLVHLQPALPELNLNMKCLEE